MCIHIKIIAQKVTDTWLLWMQLSHADVGMFSSSAASWNCGTTRVWCFPGPWRAAGVLLDWTLASSTVVASRLPSRGTRYCWDISAHVSWTFNETWWKWATYLETHVGSSTVASQYKKAKEFLSCCMEKSGPEVCYI